MFFSIAHSEKSINDLSNELILIYQLVQDSNKDFFIYLREISKYWTLLELIIEKNSKEFISIYSRYSNDFVSDQQMEDLVTAFVYTHISEFNGILNTSFNVCLNNFINEVLKNFHSKFRRMKKIERNKGRLRDQDILNNCESALKSAFYMHFRFLYNNSKKLSFTDPFSSAIFYFIREFCYASMFRYNKSGHFNVPYGGIQYNRKDFAKKIDMLESTDYRNHLRNVAIYNLDFELFLNTISPDEKDFIFIDPPYDSEFSTYAKNGFTQFDQKRLAEYLYKCKAQFMLVIKSTPFILELYKDKGFQIISFEKQYVVSFQNRNDKQAEHLIILNY